MKVTLDKDFIAASKVATASAVAKRVAKNYTASDLLQLAKSEYVDFMYHNIGTEEVLREKGELIQNGFCEDDFSISVEIITFDCNRFVRYRFWCTVNSDGCVTEFSQNELLRQVEVYKQD